MSHPLPTATVVRLPATWSPSAAPLAWPWQEIAPLPPFILADGSAPARQQTTARLVYDDAALHVHFDCHDTDIWGIATARDSAIYDEEVVEVFIAPGADTPTFYYEFEVSPLGTLLDLTVHSPNGNRTGLITDFAWNCPGIEWQAHMDRDRQRWQAYLRLPWQSIGAGSGLPPVWRANFYRIERTRGEAPEFSCWSPTLTDPADYHRPARFGTLHLAPPA